MNGQIVNERYVPKLLTKLLSKQVLFYQIYEMYDFS